MAITLNANVFLGTLTNLIAYSQTAYTADKGGMSALVKSCQNINIDSGDGKVIRSADLLSVGDTNFTNSSLLTRTNPTVSEQVLQVSDYKNIPLSVNRYLLKGAWLSETAMAEFIAYLMQIMEVTKEAHIYNELVSLHETYTPTQASQTETLHLFDVATATTAQDINAMQTYNAKAIYKKLINLAREMSAPTNKYNDKAYKEIIDVSKLKVVIKGDDYCDMVTDALAELLNSQKITGELNYGETIVIPNGQFSNAIGNRHVFIMHKDKFQFGYFYNVATAFFDGSNLNQNNWLHFAYYIGSVDAYPCVVIEFAFDKALA